MTHGTRDESNSDDICMLICGFPAVPITAFGEPALDRAADKQEGNAAMPMERKGQGTERGGGGWRRTSSAVAFFVRRRRCRSCQEV